MKFNSLDDIKALPSSEQDKVLKNYWKTKEIVFYGEFVPEIEEPEKRSGVLRNIKIPKSSWKLKYPFTKGFISLVVPKTKKLEKGYYKFTCRNNNVHLQILLNSCERISEEEYYGKVSHIKAKSYISTDSDKKDPRYVALEDNMHGWGKHIHQLIGSYTLSEDGKPYLDNILTQNLSKITEYPSKEDKKASASERSFSRREGRTTIFL